MAGQSNPLFVPSVMKTHILLTDDPAAAILARFTLDTAVSTLWASADVRFTSRKHIRTDNGAAVSKVLE